MPELMKKLIAALGLATTASEDEAIAACVALKSNAATIDGLQGEIAVLKTRVMDPTKFVPVEVVNELKQQVAALNTRVSEREVDDLIAAAIAAGKLATPAEQAYARTVGRADIAALKSYIEASPAIAALKGQQSGGHPPKGTATDGQLTTEQIAICSALNLDPEEYKKTLAAAAK